MDGLIRPPKETGEKEAEEECKRLGEGEGCN